MRGNAELKARIAGLEKVNQWAKAGIIFRESPESGTRNVAALLSSMALR